MVGSRSAEEIAVPRTDGTRERLQYPATIFARTRVFALAYGQRPDAVFAEKCVAEIERLVKMGFDDAARLKSDPDLKSTQEFELFREIVARIEGK